MKLVPKREAIDAIDLILGPKFTFTILRVLCSKCRFFIAWRKTNVQGKYHFQMNVKGPVREHVNYRIFNVLITTNAMH